MKVTRIKSCVYHIIDQNDEEIHAEYYLNGVHFKTK